MTTDFCIEALDHRLFADLGHLSKAGLQARGIRVLTADTCPGFPCRLTLEDTPVGEEVYLLPYEHHATDSPYKAAGPIFIRKNQITRQYAVNEIPPILHHRLLSLRGYDAAGMMVYACVTEGAQTEEKIREAFGKEKVAYLHIHNAKPGCYNCSVKRA